MKPLLRTADCLTPHPAQGAQTLLLVERPADLRFSGVHEVHVGLDGAVIHRCFTQRWLFAAIEMGRAELRRAELERDDEVVTIITAVGYSGHSHAHALELARAALPTPGALI